MSAPRRPDWAPFDDPEWWTLVRSHYLALAKRSTDLEERRRQGDRT